MDYGIILGVLSPALLVLLMGYIWWRFPPKKINYLYGYRTRSSMRNQQTWDFANRIGPVMLIRTGVYLVLIGVLAIWLTKPRVAVWISGIAMVLGLIGGMMACEKKLARHFDEDGNPRA